MLRKLLDTIINSGTDFQSSLFEKRRVRFLNILYIISIVSAESYSIIYSLIDFTVLLPLIIFSNIFVLLCIAGIWLNKKNKTIISQHVLCIILSLIPCITTFFQIGTVANSHFYFLLFAMVPILVWRLKQILPIITYFSINTVLYIYAQYIWIPPHTLIIFPATAAMLISIFTVIAVFVSLLAAHWINFTQIKENEIQLSLYSSKLEEMLVALKQQHSELFEQKALVENLNATLSNKNQTLTELNATKDKFFSIIAHDLKSPFNSILGFSKFLSQNYHDFTENQRIQSVNHIYKSSNQTYKLLENLLDWSRSQSGAMEFKPEMVNIYLSVAETISVASIAAQEKDIRFNINIDKSIDACVDKEMFNTIIRNLLNNAVKYSNREGIVSLQISIQDYNIITIVSDNGIGISKEYTDSIFSITDKQIHNGTENEKGTGIGLLLCKEFAEKHKGTIWVESEFGKGSTFSFTIPYQQN